MKTKELNVGDLQDFLKDKSRDMTIGVMDGHTAYPLAHMFYWEQEDAPYRIVLAKSIYGDTNEKEH